MEELRTALEKKNLTVSNRDEKGRCLFTTKDFYPGEIVIFQEPYVCVPNNSNTMPKCNGCFGSAGLKKCSACQALWYCGRSCQKLEWKLHRLECEALSQLDSSRKMAITPSIRLMARLYIRKKLEFDKVIESSSMDNYGLVEALVSHMDEVDEKQLVTYAQMANLVNMILRWPDLNIKEVAENFSKLACNAHTICDSELRPQGTGLYPVISLINHSCFPNAVLVFEGRMAVVRAVQHIPKGAEVTIPYIEIAGSTVTRQKTLKEQYYFTCSCTRCLKVGQSDDIKESAIYEGYCCKNEKCSGFLLRDSDDKGFICQQCGLLRSKEEVKKIAIEITKISEKAPKYTNSSNLLDTISVYKDIESLERKLYHPSSIKLMQTREKLLKMLMDLEDWKEALSYCRLTIPVYHRVYPEFHPLLGLQYYTCGKLEWLLGETEAAVRSLTKAMDILRITHGKDVPFIKELAMKLEEARAEASYRLSAKDDD